MPDCSQRCSRGYGATPAAVHEKALVASHVSASETGCRLFLMMLISTQHAPKLPAFSTAAPLQCNAQESSEAAATQAEATLKETRESAEAAAARATADYESLRRVLDAVNAQKAELDSRLAKAGGALNAAEELREAK